MFVLINSDWLAFYAKSFLVAANKFIELFHALICYWINLNILSNSAFVLTNSDWSAFFAKSSLVVLAINYLIKLFPIVYYLWFSSYY